ncbi:MAG: threonine aldolase [Deltaproteobacteria bacterium]|jgi:threonine aldolase|nr:threonine aldolase [Deltaproteobacteria bacterium]
MKFFASDNNSGVHPLVLEAIQAANTGNVASYGDDPFTRELEGRFKEVFGEGTRAFPVSNGTAANVVPMRAALRPWEGVICDFAGHINTDECGALEAAGRKIYPVAGVNGKITPELCAPLLRLRNGCHHVHPRMVYVTQSTEFGTAYSVEELKALSEFCRQNDLLLHMDGSRLGNAAAHLNTSLRAISRDVGVDVLALGGTKNGLMGAEAVLFFNPDLAPDFELHRKQCLQLMSKMRFVSAQLLALMNNELWRQNASQANAATRLLADRIQGLPGLKFTRPVQVNAIFLRLPKAAAEKLLQEYAISTWTDLPDTDEPIVAGPEMRIMTCFNTTEQQVEELAKAIAAALE